MLFLSDRGKTARRGKFGATDPDPRGKFNG